VRLLRLKLAWLIDWAIPVRRGQVCFVSKRNAPISGNLRVMLDVMAAEPGLRVIAYKEGHTHAHTAAVLRLQGVELIDRFSLGALITLLSSELVVLSHSARDAYLTRRKRGRAVVNLWHGVAIKRIEAMMLPRGSLRAHRSRQRRIAENSRLYDAVIASNPVDQLVNALAFAVPHHRVHPIGLPRFDYLLEPWQQWPDDLRAQRQALEAQLKGRQLILYAPTFREGGSKLADLITADDLALIREHCQANGSVLGIRPHPYWEGQQQELCDGDTILNAGTQHLPEPAVALSLASVLVADYSSIWVDYLLLNRPIFGLMPDLEGYIDKERGFLYNLEDVFPGAIMETWREFLLAATGQSQDNPHTQPQNPKASILLLPFNRTNPTIRNRCQSLLKQWITKEAS
jgi:CDP-glycerol glycerophosphotransferase (TagB/SpsB family)